MEEVKCPITCELYKEPVIAVDGNTYEKEAIVDWLERKLTSPLTNAPLYSKLLIPNKGMKRVATIIQQKVNRNPRSHHEVHGELII